MWVKAKRRFESTGIWERVVELCRLGILNVWRAVCFVLIHNQLIVGSNPTTGSNDIKYGWSNILSPDTSFLVYVIQQFRYVPFRSFTPISSGGDIFTLQLRGAIDHSTTTCIQRDIDERSPYRLMYSYLDQACFWRWHFSHFQRLQYRVQGYDVLL